MSANGETVIYTDGACKGNPGPGGWAYVQMVDGVEVQRATGSAVHTTNNRMEMQALIEVLESYAVSQPLHVVTDSTYVTKGLQEWLPGWKRDKWLTASRKPVANKDLWLRLDALQAGRSLHLSWVKGHASSVGNQLADSYAQAAAERSEAGG